jgi:rod shape-determining protein MreC
LKAGDLLITSGLGGVFPRNYPVAIVSEVIIQNSKPFAKVTATPTALLDKSREVLLIWPQEQPEAESAPAAESPAPEDKSKAKPE